MLALNRRGLTLVELLVALVLLSIVSAALYRVLVSNQRIYDAQMQAKAPGLARLLAGSGEYQFV